MNRSDIRTLVACRRPNLSGYARKRAMSRCARVALREPEAVTAWLDRRDRGRFFTSASHSYRTVKRKEV